MSEDTERAQGPTMIAATNILRPPPAVIGSINQRLTLPRTVKLTTILFGGVGACLGLLVATAVAGAGFQQLMYGSVLGAAAGWLVVNYSPLSGESMLTWLGLTVRATTARKVSVDGKPVRLYIGIAPLHRTAAGTVRMLPGAVPVQAAQWDERGVPLPVPIPGADKLAGSPLKKGRDRLRPSTELSTQGRKPPKQRSRKPTPPARPSAASPTDHGKARHRRRR
ncbi:hypothetical protein [Bailinhaonella thermotolerans]|uniref:Uncharacterized protein n=1 Tax=Bailinhaonella thermotolerans TaxID=1070861 RepID=A0A3A4AX61_9ACTN|nr:hypothetical protein [Bailinhaonella thermotolerans]RJL24022.1 hypothetical protein D5H75_31850 [Bailinhaonella thermotolerans]